MAKLADQTGTDGGYGATQTTPTYTPPDDVNLSDYNINLVAVTPGVVQANTGVTVRWTLTDNSQAQAEQQSEEDYGGS
tara:strand:+ start:3078 stop:3311 length:234 start_codon:yes stop_codon:yes gene_type:complete